MILVGDIGGTNTRLALVDPRTRSLKRHDSYRNRSFKSLYHAIDAFLPERPKLNSVCIGVAAPIIDGRANMTNFSWRLDERELSRKLKVSKARLVNDLVAIGWGAAHAPKKKLTVLSHGLPDKRGKNLAIIAPGTGLGEAALVATPDGHSLLGTEGSHGDFAPRNELECRLLEMLQGEFGRVSTERAICGPALPLLYRFFSDLPESKAAAARLSQADDFNVAMVELAVSGKSPRARAAVELMVSLLGAEAGNMALRYLAVGGVFVAGSLAASIVPPFIDVFREAFVAKGRYQSLLQQVPVALVNDSDIGLSGAALLAG